MTRGKEEIEERNNHPGHGTHFKFYWKLCHMLDGPFFFSLSFSFRKEREEEREEEKSGTAVRSSLTHAPVPPSSSSSCFFLLFPKKRKERNKRGRFGQMLITRGLDHMLAEPSSSSLGY